MAVLWCTNSSSSAERSLPVPVGECHHDVERRQEQHEVEERVRVGDGLLLIVHSSAGTAALLEAVSLRPVLDQSRLVAGQGQLVHLGVGGITNAGGQTGEQREDREHDAINCLIKQHKRQSVILSPLQAGLQVSRGDKYKDT